MEEEAAGGGMDVDNHPRCRRRLFFDEEERGGGGGEEDPGTADNLTNVLQEELRKSRDAAKQRWNFDFENERPLEGRWQWEAVGAASGGGDPLQQSEGDNVSAEQQENIPVADLEPQTTIHTPPSR